MKYIVHIGTPDAEAVNGNSPLPEDKITCLIGDGKTSA